MLALLNLRLFERLIILVSTHEPQVNVAKVSCWHDLHNIFDKSARNKIVAAKWNLPRQRFEDKTRIPPKIKTESIGLSNKCTAERLCHGGPLATVESRSLILGQILMQFSKRRNGFIVQEIRHQ